MAGPRFEMTPRTRALYEAEQARPKPEPKLNGAGVVHGTPQPQRAPTVDDRPTDAPQQPPERLTALEQAKKAKRAAAVKYKQAKKHDFIQRHTTMMTGLRTYPLSVRIAAHTLQAGTITCAHLLHLYSDGRSFAVSHLGGWCSRETQNVRCGSCDGCSGLLRRGCHTFCNGCNCGTTRVARLTWKRRLAWWRCPEGKFGTAPGWWSRPLRWMFGRRPKTEYDKLGRPMPLRGKNGRFEKRS